jgi:membrane protein DedA with SNARE-associated domain
MHKFIDFLATWGPLGVFVLSAVESAGPPTPGGTDWMLIAVTIARPKDAWLCAILATVGSLIGSAVFFEVMRRGGEKLLSRYTSSGRGARFRGWAQRYGLLTVLISAMVPIPILPYKFFVASTAAMGASRTRFLLVLLAARLPRYFGLAYLGATLGSESSTWIKAHLWHLGAFAALLFISLYALIRWMDRKRLE